MRIAADQNHPDWSPDAVRAQVYLDGEHLQACVVADEEAGWADCLHIVDGKAVLEGDNFAVVRLHGRVSIVIPH